MAVKYKDVRWKKVICEDLTVGEVKEVVIDTSNWKVTHLEVELTGETADLVLGIKKGGIRNLLAVSAIGEAEKKIKLKVTKGQLHIYLKPSKLK